MLHRPFFSEKRPNVTIFLPKVCPLFQQNLTKIVVDIPLGKKCFTSEKVMYYFVNFNFFGVKHLFLRRYNFHFFLSEMVEMYPFRPFSVENTIVYREEFSKLKHSNYDCYIVLFFSQKQAKCNHFSTEGMSTFSEISDKKSGRYTFGKNVSLRKNECFTSKNFNIPEVKHLYLRRYSFHFFCPKRLKCNHIGHFLLKIP